MVLKLDMNLQLSDSGGLWPLLNCIDLPLVYSDDIVSDDVSQEVYGGEMETDTSLV